MTYSGSTKLERSIKMAVWQFQSYIIPSDNIDIVNNEDNAVSWHDRKIENISVNFLPLGKSWSKDIVIYGNVEETCFELLYDDKALVEISCRLDLRSLTKSLLHNVINYVQSINGFFFYKGKSYPPNYKEIVNLLKESDANRWCENPAGFIQSLNVE